MDEWLEADVDERAAANANTLTQAELSKHGGKSECYLIKFKAKRPLAAFFCQQKLNYADTGVYTTPPHSTTLDHPEVLRLAQKWLHDCLGPAHKTCPDESFDRRPRKYPSRLIELPQWSARYPTSNDQKVYLRNTNNCDIKPWIPDDQRDGEVSSRSYSPRGEYVTLSHRWGAQIKKLTDKTTREFMDGVSLGELAQSFRDAIDFARRLRKDIRYIWIDALCIIQSQPNKTDWKIESARMHDVYHNSLLNISATAAENSHSGLFVDRNPQELWHSDIDLNVGDDFRDSVDPNGVYPYVMRCSIQEASAWDRLVDHAPVNRRGWVLQERLLAPRVLHFCRNQIAWECRHLDATESLPNGVISLGLRHGKVDRREQLKSLTPQEYGQRSFARNERMFAAGLEYWQSVVQKYSRTSLTDPTDRLIALAGIAELASRQFDPNVRYVAGLWGKWLASQLLWKVNVQRQHGIVMDHGVTRPPQYVAPTFSWASLEAPHGVQCSKILPDKQMLFSVEAMHIAHPAGGSRFGAVAPGCCLELHCIVEPVEIYFKNLNGVKMLRWRLQDSEEHANIVRDCPQDDQIELQGSTGYVGMRAHRSDDGVMLYLLLKQVQGSDNRYRRIAWAQTSRHQGSIYQASDASSTRSPSEASDGTDSLNLQIFALRQEVEKLRRQNADLKGSSLVRRVSSGFSDRDTASITGEQFMPMQRIFLE